jgi:membrane associated rhomboid family serine protease
MSSVLEDLKNSFSRTSSGLNQIILINVIVFVILIFFKVVMFFSGIEDVYNFICHQIFLPASFDDFIYKPWSLLTYFFAHDVGNFFHIIFNMFFLYTFGQLITEFLGNRRLISIYFLGGLFSGIIYLLAYNLIPYLAQNADRTVLLGASGAVYAVVIGAAVLLPDYTFFLIFLGPVKIKYIAAFYVLLSFAQTIGPNAGGNIAHLGGAGFGALYIWQLRRGNDIGKPFENFFAWLTGLFKQKPKIKVTYKNTDQRRSGAFNPNDVSQEEIDSILDKISKFGYEKLTKEEKQKLFKASQSTHI